MLKFDRHFDSTASHVPLIFQNDGIMMTFNPAAWILCEIFQLDTLWPSRWIPCVILQSKKKITPASVKQLWRMWQKKSCIPQQQNWQYSQNKQNKSTIKQSLYHMWCPLRARPWHRKFLWHVMPHLSFWQPNTAGVKHKLCLHGKNLLRMDRIYFLNDAPLILRSLCTRQARKLTWLTSQLR